MNQPTDDTSRPLGDRIQPDPDHDPSVLLDVFVTWVAEQGLELYPAQEEALLEWVDERHVILNTPTGSGKSLVATAAHWCAWALGRRSFYTSPIKALVSEKFFALCATFGAERVGMMTGDAAINADAPIVCCTAEVLASLALRRGVGAGVDVVIMDEFHYFGDRDRGMAWQVPLLELPRTQFLLMSATLGDVDPIRSLLERTTGRPVAWIRSAERPVPLEWSWSEAPLVETLMTLVDRDRSPVYVVNFSQREATELAGNLMSVNWSDADRKRRIAEALRGFRFDSPFGRSMRRWIQHGLGLHHAGLLPKYRLLVEKLAQQGLLRIICGTDTLGVGVNVPIRTVLFTRLYKFDGDRRKILAVRDFHQIAGRAGRRGFDTVGYVVCQAPAHQIENAKLAAKHANGKFQKKQPEKGWVPWDAQTFAKLQDASPEPLLSVFRIDHSTLLQLLLRPDQPDQPGGYRGLLALIDRSMEHPGAQRRHRRHAAVLLRSLRSAGLVERVTGEVGVRSARLVLAEELGTRFSAFHALSTWLLDAVAALPMDDPEAHAWQVISLVEAMLENPTQVLQAQVQQQKRALLATLKAEGVEYEERMALLEQVTWPKPLEAYCYQSFNAFVARHPWLADEHIRPKSVARDMLEQWMTFGEYVSELGLEAVEGVLLRHLSQVWRVLSHTVPEVYRTPVLEESMQRLRVIIQRVDSSLLQEWERLQAGEEAGSEGLLEASSRPRRVDEAILRREVRAELHAWVRCLQRRDVEGLLELVQAGAEEEDAWSAQRLAHQLQALWVEGVEVAFHERSRLADNTRMVRDGEGGWQVEQRLWQDDSPLDWHLVGRVHAARWSRGEGPWVAWEGVQG
jgi:superfamily II RNA helicase